MSKKVKPGNFEIHATHCAICKAPAEIREELESDFLDWTPINELIEKYGDKLRINERKNKDGEVERRNIENIKRTISRHLKFKKLYEKRNYQHDAEEKYVFKQMDKASENKTVKPADGLKAVELSSKLKKKIGDKPGVNINVLNQRIFGDLSELTDAELDREIALLEKLKRQTREAIELEPVAGEVGEGKEES